MLHAEAHDQVGERRAGDQLDDRFDDLGNGCREHVALSLVIAAVNGRETAEQHRRRQRQHRVDRVGGLDDLGIREADDHQSDHADGAYHREQRHGQTVYLLDVLVVLFRHALRDHARDDDRQTARRDDEDDAEHLVGVAVDSHAHRGKAVAEHGVDVGEDDLVEQAEHLDDDHADGQYRRALDKALGNALVRVGDRVIFF